MRLKSLEMHGFKSFPDRTKINFTSGVTVIVGPNGSGKSNISDAIRWVLGELSSKNVRGNKMEDVIFGGTERRPAMGYAEVSLTIDNSGESRIDIDYDEITITRRLYRSGDSEYLINNKPSRLRDIHDMFFNTGIGKTGYSIIGQGKISEIVSQKSEERRIIFEEAAGISKYRIKKQDAERRLKETDENLVRLTDILSEIETRVGPLEKEAAKARIYLDLYEKKKAIEVALILYDIAKVSENREMIERDCLAAKHELDIVEEALSGLETRIDRLSELQIEKKIQFDAETQRHLRLNEEKHEKINSLSLAKNELVHLDEAKGRTCDSLDRERELFISKNAEKENLLLAINTAEEELEKLNGEYELTENRLSEQRKSISSLADFLETLEASKKELEERLYKLRLEISTRDAAKNSFYERQDEISSDLSLSKERLLSLQNKQDAGKKTVNEYNLRLRELEEKLAELRALIAKKEEEISRKNSEYSFLISEIASKEQTSLALRRMEEHFEGYSRSVKFIADQAASGKLRGICGPVSKLIKVERRFTIAIETALGANIQNIVTEDERAAKDAISRLKQENAGRATFYPLTSIRASGLNIDMARLKSFDGFLGVASDIVAFDNKYLQVILYLLGRTVIFDNLENASKAAEAFKYSFRIVTLDGQVINAGGSYTGGSVKQESGILSRSAQIEAIIAEKNKLEGRSKALYDELLQAKKELGEQKDDENSALSDISVLSSLIKAEETSLSIIEKNIAEESEKAISLENSLKRMSDMDNEKNEETENMRALCRETEEKLGDSDGEIDKSKAELAKLEARRDELISLKNASFLECSLKKRDIENLLSRKNETEATLSSVQNETDRLTASLAEIKSRESALKESCRELESAIESLERLIVEVEEENKNLSSESLELEKEINDLRTASREKTNRKVECLASYNSLSLRLEKINSDRDKLAEKLFEEYELSYSDAQKLQYESVNETNRSKKSSELARYKSKIKELGPVNVGSIEEFKEVSERYEFLKKQTCDLAKSSRELTDIIGQLEKEMCEKFSETFAKINENFKSVFAELFGGGSANLYLSDPDNVLQSGIEIEVAPPGKIIKNLRLLSGGEQVFVAIAIFFAILKVNPSPFCLLDEIESALDEVNVDRFAAYSKMYSENTQFIIITHRRGTMEVADTLYGITMQEKGISKVLVVNMNEIQQKTGVNV